MARRRDDDEDLDRDDVDDAIPDDDAPSRRNEDDRPAKPRAKNTWVTITLAILNLLAAGAFGYLLLMVYNTRAEWKNGSLANTLRADGVPLKGETEASLSAAARPRIKADHARLDEQFNKRPGVKRSSSEPFQPVNEVNPLRITADMLTDSLLKQHFAGEPPVRTLEEEVDRVRNAFNTAVDEAVQNYPSRFKDGPSKAQAARTILLPMAWSTTLIRTLDAQISKAQGADLDALLKEAVHRRLLADVLIPLQEFRPGDLEQSFVEKMADLAAVKLDDLKAVVDKRFEQAKAANYDPDVHYGKIWLDAMQGQPGQRDSAEKRQSISFLLYSIGQARVPGVNPPDNFLVPNYLKRVELVVGQHEVAMAAFNYDHVLQNLQARMVEAIVNDRAGYLVVNKAGAPTTTDGYQARYESQIDRNKKIAADIVHARSRLADLNQQAARFEAQVAERKQQFDSLKADLAKAQGGTAEETQKLRLRQEQLFQAQAELSDAAERNQRLENEIRTLEYRLLGASR